MPRVTVGDRVRVEWAPQVPVSWHNPTAEALPLTGVVRAVSRAGFHLALTDPARRWDYGRPVDVPPQDQEVAVLWVSVARATVLDAAYRAA